MDEKPLKPKPQFGASFTCGVHVRWIDRRLHCCDDPGSLPSSVCACAAVHAATMAMMKRTMCIGAKIGRFAVRPLIDGSLDGSVDGHGTDTRPT